MPQICVHTATATGDHASLAVVAHKLFERALATNAGTGELLCACMPYCWQMSQRHLLPWMCCYYALCHLGLCPSRILEPMIPGRMQLNDMLRHPVELLRTQASDKLQPRMILEHDSRHSHKPMTMLVSNRCPTGDSKVSTSWCPQQGAALGMAVLSSQQPCNGTRLLWCTNGLHPRALVAPA